MTPSGFAASGFENPNGRWDVFASYVALALGILGLMLAFLVGFA